MLDGLTLRLDLCSGGERGMADPVCIHLCSPLLAANACGLRGRHPTACLVPHEEERCPSGRRCEGKRPEELIFLSSSFVNWSYAACWFSSV